MDEKIYATISTCTMIIYKYWLNDENDMGIGLFHELTLKK